MNVMRLATSIKESPRSHANIKRPISGLLSRESFPPTKHHDTALWTFKLMQTSSTMFCCYRKFIFSRASSTFCLALSGQLFFLTGNVSTVLRLSNKTQSGQGTENEK